MAKHAHRLALINKKTWKCTLPDCSFFVHLGLAHLLVGKTAVCHECGDVYTVDEYALKEDVPVCINCRGGHFGHKADCSVYDGGECTCR